MHLHAITCQERSISFPGRAVLSSSLGRGCFPGQVCLSPDAVCAGVTLVKIKKDFFSLPGVKCSLSLPVLESLLPCSAWRWTIPSVCAWANNDYYWGRLKPTSSVLSFLRLPQDSQIF